MEEGSPLLFNGFPLEETLTLLIYVEQDEILHLELNKVEHSKMFAGIRALLD